MSPAILYQFLNCLGISFVAVNFKEVSHCDSVIVGGDSATTSCLRTVVCTCSTHFNFCGWMMSRWHLLLLGEAPSVCPTGRCSWSIISWEPAFRRQLLIYLLCVCLQFLLWSFCWSAICSSNSRLFSAFFLCFSRSLTTPCFILYN